MFPALIDLIGLVSSTNSIWLSIDFKSVIINSESQLIPSPNTHTCHVIIRDSLQLKLLILMGWLKFMMIYMWRKTHQGTSIKLESAIHIVNSKDRSFYTFDVFHYKKNIYIYCFDACFVLCTVYMWDMKRRGVNVMS